MGKIKREQREWILVWGTIGADSYQRWIKLQSCLKLLVQYWHRPHKLFPILDLFCMSKAIYHVFIHNIYSLLHPAAIQTLMTCLRNRKMNLKAARKETCPQLSPKLVFTCLSFCIIIITEMRGLKLFSMVGQVKCYLRSTVKAPISIFCEKEVWELLLSQKKYQSKGS